LQALTQLGLRLGDGGERVDRQEQSAGLFLGHVGHFDLHLHVRIDVATQMAIDQLEPAVGQLIGEQAAGEADLAVEGLQRGTLAVAVQAEVELVRDQRHVGQQDPLQRFFAFGRAWFPNPHSPQFQGHVGSGPTGGSPGWLAHASA
jgi:hypothetical protein